MAKNTKGVSPLSAAWLNERVENVLEQAETLIIAYLEQVMSSGFLPMETPIDDKLIRRMTDAELAVILEKMPVGTEKEAFLRRLSGLSSSDQIL